MDYSNLEANYEASLRSDFEYAKWYEKLPDERKARMIKSGWDFTTGMIRQEVLKENPYASEEEIKLRFIEIMQKDKYPPDKFAFIKKTMKKRIEVDWKRRFKKMKKEMNWTYADIAKFIGAEGEASIRASVNRKLPAFAKLAVCIYEKIHHQNKKL